MREGEGKMKEVYIIMSPSGSISLSISDDKGTCYTDYEEAKRALESKNRWSESKGYGVYELISLNVIAPQESAERKENCGNLHR